MSSLAEAPRETLPLSTVSFSLPVAAPSYAAPRRQGVRFDLAASVAISVKPPKQDVHLQPVEDKGPRHVGNKVTREVNCDDDMNDVKSRHKKGEGLPLILLDSDGKTASVVSVESKYLPENALVSIIRHNRLEKEREKKKQKISGVLRLPQLQRAYTLAAAGGYNKTTARAAHKSHKRLHTAPDAQSLDKLQDLVKITTALKNMAVKRATEAQASDKRKRRDSEGSKSGRASRASSRASSDGRSSLARSKSFHRQDSMQHQNYTFRDNQDLELWRKIGGIRQGFNARERFRKIIRVVLIGLKWILTLKSKEDENGNSSSKTFTELAEQTKYVASDGLTFDVSDFKAKKDVTISNEVKAILTMPVEHRTPDHIQTAVYGLQHLQSFAEYPDHMKKKLCQVAWFAQVPPKRVIIRQGHLSENFYFILSGHVLVTILEKTRSGEAKMRTAAVMRKGMSFGELGLLHHSTRTATVQSQDRVQLLQIDRDDFFDIFMSGHRPGEMPEHIKFISQLDFMRGWPTQKLVDNPDYCLFVFFKRGSLIVKDSNNSDWLYIVKSGSCQVLRQLKQGENLPPTADSEEQEDEQRAREEALSRAREELKTAMKCFDAAAQRKTETPEGEEAAAPASESEAGEEEASEDPPVDYYQPKGHSKSKYGSYASFKTAHFDTISAPSKRNVTRAAGEEGQKDKQTPRSEEQSSAPVFVQVELLKSKDVFGLNTLEFEDEIEDPKTSVSLVSKGAECIMLSKKFFMQHVPYEANHMLKDLIRPYPSVTTLSENFSTKHNWDEYKRLLMGDVVHNVKRKFVSAVV